VGSALSYPYYGYPYYLYPYYPYLPPVDLDPVAGSPPHSQPQTQFTVAPLVQREVCYDTGCYHLQGDGVTVPCLWVWVPVAPAPPPPPSSP
jgi:hypothetical protein